MYSAGERAHRLHKLQNSNQTERASSSLDTPLSEILNSSFIPLRLSPAQPFLPSIFEKVALPALGLLGSPLPPMVAKMERLLAEQARRSNQSTSIRIIEAHGSSNSSRLSPESFVEAFESLDQLLAPQEDVSHLTLAPAKEQILKALRESPVVVISAPTSSGKTTWLPRTLEKERGSLFSQATVEGTEGARTICSVPRVLQTIKIAQYVSEVLGTPLGEKIGYCNSRTGRFTPGVTDTMYQTHGYTAQQLLNHSIREGTILLIDEVHENPADLPLILLLAREAIEKGTDIKVVIMSATIRAKVFSDYFGGAPVIDPTVSAEEAPPSHSSGELEEQIIQRANRGRNKKIQLIPALDSAAEDVVAAVERGESPLVFVSGKKEIESIIEQVAQIDPSINCRPLHAKLPLREQQAVFETTPGERIAIISTNVGGSGFTFPAVVNTVIITPEVKRMVHLDGVDELRYDRITVDEIVQLLGRIGRLKEDGRAVLRLPLTKDLSAQPLKEAIPPEIQSISLATMLLRHKAASRDLHRDNQRFIFKASQKQLAEAEELLHRLELTGSEGHITKLGRSSARFPVDAHVGKLLAKSQDVRSYQPGVLRGAIDIAAIIDAEGIVTKDYKLWQPLRSTNMNSDLIAQMEVLQNAARIPAEELAAHGISEAAFFRAWDTRQSLRHRLGISQAEGIGEPLNPNDLRTLREFVWSAFLPWLYKRVEDRDDLTSGEQLYKGVGGSGVRLLSRGSVVHNAQYIVGLPISLEVRETSERMDLLLKRISGRPKILPLILAATAVDKDWLQRNIPPQFREARDSIRSEPKGKGDQSHHTRRQPPRR